MYSFHLLDHCVADYFAGYHLPTVSVPTIGTMTGREVYRALEDEVNLYFGYLEMKFKPEDIEKALKQFKADYFNEEVFISLEEFDGMTEAEKEESEFPALFFTIGRIEQDRMFPSVVYP